MTRAPAKSPCGSCPYRRDAPHGLWHHSEYAKLPLFDMPLAEQPPAVFDCHQQDGRLCAGWVGCHDMPQTLGFRTAIAEGRLTSEEIDACLDYETSVPLFSSGAEAAAHGLQEYDNPPPRTKRVVNKLMSTKKGLKLE